jgi:glycerol-3-phosphate dehydrogenase
VTATLKAGLQPSGTPTALDYAPHMPVAEPNERRIADGADYTLADVRKAVQVEHARTLMGVLYRRSGVGLRQHFSDDEVTRVAEVMAVELGWSDEERRQEIERFRQQTDRLFGIPGTPADRAGGQRNNTYKEDPS